jgi:hypothetical protein
MKEELFGDANALGANVRVGSERYRVVGVMRAKGTMIGFDLDDTVYVPAARALELFDRDSLFEIDVLYEETAPVDEVVAGIRRVLVARHGDEDFTITTQQQMLDTLGSVLGVLTFAVAALGSISLLVGAVGHLHDHDHRGARAHGRGRTAARAGRRQRDRCCRCSSPRPSSCRCSAGWRARVRRRVPGCSARR